MGRRPNPQRKDELLDDILRFAQENGIGGMSMRPLSDALGVSTYTLTYQFGSKDGMIQALVERIHEAERGQTYNAPGLSTAERVQALFDDLRTEEGESFHRIRLESGIAIGLRTFRDVINAETPERVSGVDPRRITDSSYSVLQGSLLWATVEGLIVDWLSSGQRDRVAEAFAALIADLDQTIDLNSPQRSTVRG